MSASLEAARSCAEWLLAQPRPEDTSLYDGGAGLALALLEAGRMSGESRFGDAAHEIAESLASTTETETGLYAGLSGVAFVLREAGHPAWEDLTARVAAAEPGPLTDVISGAAGAGLWLLAAGEHAAAARLGDWLTGVAEPGPAGRWWPMQPGAPLNMPNFSHGTAGVAYFLVRLARAGGEERFLAAALDGAAYLRAIARRRDGAMAVFHAEPDAPGDYPLGWCHGPTGTARLFHALHEATGDVSFADDVRALARTVRTSGIPQQAFPGFWDNLTPCCGSVRVAEFFLDLHRSGGGDDDLAFARTMTEDILSRATVDEAGTRWSNVEFRADPPELPPGTGYMQGNAGIVTWLCRLHRFESGDDTHVSWPDSPW